MKLPVLQLTNQTDLAEFIGFWSKIYHYPLESLYNERINKDQFDLDDIDKLFLWKNGMKLSKAKENSLDQKIKSKIDLINKYKGQKKIDLEDFKKNFKDLSAVWKIFLLHIIKPNQYPIYDQHINRAYNYINGLDFSNISASSISNKNKEKFYFETYLKFTNEIEREKLKTLDEAFFAFGQFINTNRYISFVS